MGKESSELGGRDPFPAGTVDEFESTEIETPPMMDAYAETSYTAGSAGDVEGFDALYEPELDASGDITDDAELAAQREQIERTRADMSEKINAIQDKLSPGNIASQAKETVRDATIGKAQNVVGDVTGAVSGAVSDVTDSAGNIGGGFMGVIRENPIPAALAGLGIGWLFMSYRNRQSNSRARSQSGPQGYFPRRYPGDTGYFQAETRYPYRDYRSFNDRPFGTTDDTNASRGDEGAEQKVKGKVGDMAEQAQSTAGDIAGRAQDAMGQVQDTASQWAGQAQDTAGQLTSQAQDTAGQIAGTAQHQAQRAGSELDRLIHERPLAAAVGAFGIGIAVGLAIPETQQEHQWMGQTRESVMDRAQQTVQQTAQKVSAVASETVEAAKETVQQTANQAAQEQGLTGSGDSQPSSQETASTTNP